MNAVRPAAVAGMFYPATRALAAEVDDLLGGVEQTAPRLGYPKALVVPHAGYVYSGGVAARAYDELAARGSVRRVVLLGPTHRVACAGSRYWRAGLRHAARASAHRPRRHRQRAPPAAGGGQRRRACARAFAGSAAAIPAENARRFRAGAVRRRHGRRAGSGPGPRTPVGRPETLIVISTDMSHYHAYEQARAIDGATLARIAGFATDIDHERPAAPRP